MSERGKSIQQSVESASNNRIEYHNISTSTSSVRRKLFDDECWNANEKAALQDNLENMLNESRQHAMEKWNFDFENEQPLDGNWQWEKCDDSESIGISTCISTTVCTGKIDDNDESNESINDSDTISTNDNANCTTIANDSSTNRIVNCKYTTDNYVSDTRESISEQQSNNQ